MFHISKVRNIILFLVFLSYIKSDLKNIALDNGTYSEEISIENNDFVKFKVNSVKDYNYLKIKIEGKGNNADTNHIISYYQGDSNLKERKQLSQSLSGNSLMWLTKEQIENDFYFTVECAKNPCQYQVYLNGTNIAELFLDEQYTYYVTKENKQMNFTIKGNSYIDSITSETDKYMITFWVKGNKKINCEIETEGDYFSKKSDKYNYFSKYLNEFKDNNKYIIIVNGEVGDLINIGSLLFYKTYFRLTLESKLESNNFDGIELTNYLEPDNSNKYMFSKNLYNIIDFYEINNNYDINFSEDKSSFKYDTEIIEAKDQELFYSYQFIKETKYNNQGNNKYSPQLLGVYYQRSIKEGTTIGLIPMKPENDFKSLIYEVNQFSNENIKVGIYSCNNYPLCHIDKESIDKSINIENYNSYYYYEISKNELDTNFSPISKNQAILLITCEKGFHNNLCGVNVNMRTDKTLFYINEYNRINPPLFTFIGKNNENKFLFSGENKPIFLNIQTFSGKIEIKSDIKFKNDSKNVQLLYPDIESKFNITIKALEDSVYSIYDYYPKYEKEKNSLRIGGNYLLNIEEQLIVKPSTNEFDKEDKNCLYFIGFSPINCNINIYYNNNQQLIKTKEFYQDIISELDNEYRILNNNAWKCLCYASLYKIDNKNGISLSNGISHNFIFNQKYSNLTLSYPHTQKEQSVKISLKISKGGNFTINLYLNKDKYKSYNVKSNNSIELKSSDIKSNCKNFGNICKILLLVETNTKDKESTFDVTINTFKNKDKEKENNNLGIILTIIGCGVILLIVIIVVVIFLLKISSKNKDLAEKVNKTSFQQETNEEEDNGALL